MKSPSCSVDQLRAFFTLSTRPGLPPWSSGPAITASTPEVPFGGAKNSGYGRELASFGTQSFVNAKTVWIQ